MVDKNKNVSAPQTIAHPLLNVPFTTFNAATAKATPASAKAANFTKKLFSVTAALGRKEPNHPLVAFVQAHGAEVFDLGPSLRRIIVARAGAAETQAAFHDWAVKVLKGANTQIKTISNPNVRHQLYTSVAEIIATLPPEVQAKLNAVRNEAIDEALKSWEESIQYNAKAQKEADEQHQKKVQVEESQEQSAALLRQSQQSSEQTHALAEKDAERVARIAAALHACRTIFRLPPASEAVSNDNGIEHRSTVALIETLGETDTFVLKNEQSAIINAKQPTRAEPQVPVGHRRSNL